MTDAEYTVLRATIRERGTVRTVIAWLTLVLWSLAASRLWAAPAASLLPLFILAAGFEVVYALHLNVERIGRYIEVFHERGDVGGSGWESVATAYAGSFKASGPDALFSRLFLIATLLNYLGVAFSSAPPLSVIVGTAHAAFAVRVLLARRVAGRQRQEDLTRYQRLRGPVAPSAPR
jgi:hypothetical protein